MLLHFDDILERSGWVIFNLSLQLFKAFLTSHILILRAFDLSVEVIDVSKTENQLRICEIELLVVLCSERTQMNNLVLASLQL